MDIGTESYVRSKLAGKGFEVWVDPENKNQLLIALRGSKESVATIVVGDGGCRLVQGNKLSTGPLDTLLDMLPAD